MLEYALMVALIAVVCIGGVSFLGQRSAETFYEVHDKMEAAMGGVDETPGLGG